MKKNIYAASFILVSLFLTSTALYADEFISGYHVDANYLILNKNLEDNGRIKDFDKLRPVDIATIYHELWHAWFIRAETKRKGTLYQMMASRADNLYTDYPADKRMEMYEESIADFIDAVVDTYVSVKRFLESKPPERRAEIIHKTQYLQNTYGRVFIDKYNGYYTRTISAVTEHKDQPTSLTWEKMADIMNLKIHEPKTALDTFILQAESNGLPVDYIKEACNAINGVIFIDPTPLGVIALQADVVFADVYLDTKDINTICATLFERKLMPDAKKVFSNNSESNK